MRIPSGVTDQYVYFVATDSADLVTRETGLSSFTVYRSRNGGAAVAMTTPTINETSAANMPGVYELLLDEDMTIGSGNDSEEMVFHITHSGMAPVTRVIELYRPKITAGRTLNVDADGDIPWNADWDAEVQSEAADALNAYDPPTKAEMDSGLAALNDLSAAQVNAEVDTALSDYDGPTTAEMVAAFALLNNLSAAEVNAEVDTALADYDAPTKAELDAGLAALPTATQNATELLDQAAGVETGLTVRQAFRLFASALLGKAAGLDTTTAVFRDTQDSKDRITATVDADGNRSAVTLDGS